MINEPLEYFFDVMANRNGECEYVGFTHHPTLNMGQFFLEFDRDCKSPIDESWPMYLAEELPTKDPHDFPKGSYFIL